MGKCFYESVENRALIWAEKKESSFEWNYLLSGDQKISLKKNPGIECFFLDNNGIYIDPVLGTAGPLKLPVASQIARNLVNGPVISKDRVPLIKEHLAKLVTNIKVTHLTQKPKNILIKFVLDI